LKDSRALKYHYPEFENHDSVNQYYVFYIDVNLGAVIQTLASPDLAGLCITGCLADNKTFD